MFYVLLNWYRKVQFSPPSELIVRMELPPSLRLEGRPFPATQIPPYYQKINYGGRTQVGALRNVLFLLRSETPSYLYKL